MKGLDLIHELPDNMKIAVQGDVSEEYSANWWAKMVNEALLCSTASGYLSYREETDKALIDLLIAHGSPESEHKTKSGKYIIGSVFTTKKAYNNYRSNKSIIAKAKANNIPLLDDKLEIVPKSALQNKIKECTKKASADPHTPYDVAICAVGRIARAWPSLTDEQKRLVIAIFPEG